MIRLQNKVPEVYINESRDFQLFLRLYDCIYGGVKYDIDSIQELNNPDLANDEVLELLCSKIGFFPTRHYDSNLLRYIIKSFSHILKYKGSRKGIEEAISTILKVEQQYDAEFNLLISEDNYEVQILTTIELYNKQALEEILEYIMPTGYKYTIGKYDYKRFPGGEINIPAKFVISKMPQQTLSQVRGLARKMKGEDNVKNNPFDWTNPINDKYFGSIDVATVVGSNISEANKLNDNSNMHKDNKQYSKNTRNNANTDTIDLETDTSGIKKVETIKEDGYTDGN